MNQRRIAYFSYFLIFAIGVESEFNPYAYGEITNKNIGMFLLCASLITLYLVPLGYILHHLKEKFNIPKFFIPVTLLSGMFIAGSLSGYGNDGIESAWRLILSESFMDNWADALTAPFVEEILKAIPAICTLYFFKRYNFGAGLIAGISAGLGFQIIEDLGYIYRSVTSSIEYGPADAFLRVSGALSSHWIYTAIVTVGILLIAYYRQKEKGLARKGWFFILSTIAIHFIWNSPISTLDHTWEMPIIQPLLTAATLYIGLLAYEVVCKQEKKRVS